MRKVEQYEVFKIIWNLSNNDNQRLETLFTETEYKYTSMRSKTKNICLK